jgi:ABC-type phosphate transport system substrate-binding protein
MRNRVLIFGLLLVAAAATAAYATEFAVIVNPSNPVRAMSLAEFGRILKGKSPIWPTGRNVAIVLRDPGSPGMKFVIEKVMGVGVEEGEKLLSDATHRTSSPVTFAQSDAEIVKFVESNPSAIGVVDVYNISGGVKVIRIDDKQPFDPGYVLKGH